MTADCPRAKSSMTPCVLRDGKDALADDGACVGCLALMTTSESPTHPDAPRAGGETPDLLPCPFCGETRVRAYCTGGWWCIRCTQRKCQAHAYPFAETEADAVAAWNRRASLLARHRDGERESFEARVGRMTLAGELRVHRASVTPGHFVARHVPSSIDACELSAELAIRAVLRELDAAMSAGPSPERASK